MPKTLKALAAAIRTKFPQYQVEIDKGSADVSRKIPGSRLVAYNKFRYAGRLSVYEAPRDFLSKPIFQLNLAETYRRVREGVAWLETHQPRVKHTDSLRSRT